MEQIVSQAVVTVGVGLLAPSNTPFHGKDHRTHRDLPLSLSADYHPPMTATRSLPHR